MDAGPRTSSGWSQLHPGTLITWASLATCGGQAAFKLVSEHLQIHVLLRTQWNAMKIQGLCTEDFPVPYISWRRWQPWGALLPSCRHPPSPTGSHAGVSPPFSVLLCPPLPRSAAASHTIRVCALHFKVNAVWKYYITLRKIAEIDCEKQLYFIYSGKNWITKKTSLSFR